MSALHVDDSVNDQELEHRILNYLSSRNVPGLRRLRVAVHAGIVTLQGQVYTFYEKQLSIQCCQRVAGVLGLIDEVGVVAAAPGVAVTA